MAAVTEKIKIFFFDGKMDHAGSVTAIEDTINAFLTTLTPGNILSVEIATCSCPYGSVVPIMTNPKMPWWYVVTVLYKS